MNTPITRFFTLKQNGDNGTRQVQIESPTPRVVALVPQAMYCSPPEIVAQAGTVCGQTSGEQ